MFRRILGRGFPLLFKPTIWGDQLPKGSGLLSSSDDFGTGIAPGETKGNERLEAQKPTQKQGKSTC